MEDKKYVSDKARELYQAHEQVSRSAYNLERWGEGTGAAIVSGVADAIAEEYKELTGRSIYGHGAMKEQK